jgi:hypothetical protein
MLAGAASMVYFPAGMPAMWGILGLVEMIVAALAVAWLYQEY